MTNRRPRSSRPRRARAQIATQLPRSDARRSAAGRPTRQPKPSRGTDRGNALEVWRRLPRSARAANKFAGVGGALCCHPRLKKFVRRRNGRLSISRSPDVVRMGAGRPRWHPHRAQFASALAEVDLTAFGDRIITRSRAVSSSARHFARVLVQLGLRRGPSTAPACSCLDEPNREPRSAPSARSSWKRREACRAPPGGHRSWAVLHDLNLATPVRPIASFVARPRPPSSPTAAASRDHQLTPCLEQVFGVTGAIGRVPSPGMALRAAACDGPA